MTDIFKTKKILLLTFQNDTAPRIGDWFTNADDISEKWNDMHPDTYTLDKVNFSQIFDPRCHNFKIALECSKCQNPHVF